MLAINGDGRRGAQLLFHAVDETEREDREAEPHRFWNIFRLGGIYPLTDELLRYIKVVAARF